MPENISAEELNDIIAQLNLTEAVSEIDLNNSIPTVNLTELI
jgi:hypothetical protein